MHHGSAAVAVDTLSARVNPAWPCRSGKPGPGRPTTHHALCDRAKGILTCGYE